MDFIAKDQFPLFVLLVLPGFVSTKVYEMLVPGARSATSDRVLDALAYGSLNLGIWYVVLMEILLPIRGSNPWAFRAGVVGILVVSPIVLGLAASVALRSRWLRRWIRHPIATAWDFHLSKEERGWVLVRLKSGLMLGGFFDKKSFASSDPAHRDLYIEQVWKVDADGRFIEPVGQSRGVLVSMADCQSVEFFSDEEAGKQVNDATATAESRSEAGGKPNQGERAPD